MNKKLKQVLRELNISKETAINFLKSRKNLGQVDEMAGFYTLLTNEQYDALKTEYGKA